MNTLEFLQRVLPTAGMYAMTIVFPGGARNGFYSTVEELATVVQKSDKLNQNVYFAVSAYISKGKRNNNNVRATKIIALDLDVGDDKPHQSQKDALIELFKFLKKTKLPIPMLVSSGRGLHCYWVLTSELEPMAWRPLAEAMKAAALAEGLAIDPSVTADSARVLRAIGTTNRKSGKKAKLILNRPDVDPLRLRQSLDKYSTKANPTQAKARPVSALTAALAATQTYAPANPDVVAAKCQQIGWGATHQDDVSEPFWYAMMGVAAHCHNPEQTAVRWSQEYTGYDQDETLAKLDQWRASTTGPATCARFQAERPAGCKGCPFAGKISTPVQVGIQAAAVEVEDAPHTIADEVQVPKPFKRTDTGIKVVIDNTDVDVCSFDIYPVGYGMDESLGYETVRYCWKRLHSGWKPLAFRQAYLVEGHRDFATAIADQGIVLSSKRQTELFQLMLRAYMDELRKLRGVTNLYATMGWKEDFAKFVMGNNMLRVDETGAVVEDTISLSTTSQRQGAEFYGTKGTLEDWAAYTSLLTAAKMPAHAFALNVGLSAPLYAFTGLKGIVVSLYGATGGGKTLAQYWVQSIYGDPDKLHFAAKFTQNTLFARMGLYSNMPMTIDEATMMDDKDVGDFCYWVTQGRDKARLNRNAEERDARTWALPVIVSTNKSLQSKLVASGLDTDAQMARLFEVSVEPHKMFTKSTDAGRKVYHHVTNHYGTAGREFIKRLLELGYDNVRILVDNAVKQFSEKYQCEFQGEERYWEQAIVLADLAGRLAHEWGIIRYTPEMGTLWVLDQLNVVRKSVADNKVDSFDLLAEYIADHADTAVTIMTTGNGKPTLDFNKVPRADIRIRFEVYRDTTATPFDRGTMLVDRAHFRKWLSSRGGDYRSFISSMTGHGVIATPKSNKASLGKDTPIKLAQAYVIGFNLRHPRFVGILDFADKEATDLTSNNVRTIRNSLSL